MSQNWTTDTFAAGHVAQTDLQNMENNFAVLKSCFSGAAAPADTVAFMLWGDTAQKVLKVRNNADDAWLGLMHGDTSEKRLAYRNAALEGYARDAGVTDKVIALKGGGTYVAGAATAGSWTLAGLTSVNESAHTHAGGSHTHALQNESDSVKSNDGWVRDPSKAPVIANGVVEFWEGTGASYTARNVLSDVTASGSANTGAGSAHNHVISHDGTSRIAAAVCILIYLDL